MPTKNVSRKSKLLLVAKLTIITAIACNFCTPAAISADNTNTDYKTNLSSIDEQEFIKSFVWDSSFREKNEKITKLEKDVLEKFDKLNLDPNYVFKTTDWKGYSLLHLATFFPFYDNFLKKLLKLGADVNLLSQDGSDITPLHYACLGSLNNIKTLMETGKIKNISAQDYEKKNPLQYLDATTDQKINKIFLSEAKKYLKTECDAIDFFSKEKITEQEADDFIKNFIKKLNNPNYKVTSKDNAPIISLAIDPDFIKFFDKLIKEPNLNVNATDKRGDNPLFYALSPSSELNKDQKKHVITKLIELGANPYQVNNANNTILNYLEKQKNQEFIDFIKKLVQKQKSKIQDKPVTTNTPSLQVTDKPNTQNAPSLPVKTGAQNK